MADKLYEIIARVLMVSSSEITDKSGPETIEKWDSFNGYVLLDEIETGFGIKFSLDEVIKIKNVGDIKKMLQDHGISLGYRLEFAILNIKNTDTN